MRCMAEADLPCDPGNGPGGLQQQPFGLLKPIILKVGHRGHPVDLHHHLGQIVGMIVHLFLKYRIRDIVGVILPDEQLDLLGKPYRGGVRGRSMIPVQVLQEQLEGSLPLPIPKGLRLMVLLKEGIQCLHGLQGQLHVLGNKNGACIGVVQEHCLFVGLDQL